MPEWKPEISRCLQPLRLPPAREAAIADELAQLLDDEYHRSLAAGATEREAREIACEALTGGKLVEELRRAEQPQVDSPQPGEMRGGSFLGDFRQDFRYAARVLAKSPGFTSLAVLSLALGIGGNAAMFGIVSAVLIRPLPYAHPDRLVRADNSGYYPPGGLVSLQQGSRTMDIAGYDPGVDLSLTGQADAVRLTGSVVSANLFAVLNVAPQAGRLFAPGDDQPGRDRLVILSDAVWRNTFGGDRGAIGRSIKLGGIDRQIAGIMPAGFAFPDAKTQFWIPLRLDPRDQTAYWAVGFMPVLGRLRDGITLDQAQREIQALSRSMISLYPYPMGRDFNRKATVVPLQEFLVSGVKTRLLVLQCAIGLVLLIACVNVASLLLARGSTRQKEMALRVALGAARGRLVRQLLTESVTLALAGGAAGIGLAFAAFSVLRLALPATTAGLSSVHLGWQELVFAAVLSVFTGIAFGLAPAASASRNNLASIIRAGGQRSGGQAKATLRSILIAGEVALAVVLAIGAGLLIKSLWLLVQVNPGFQAQRVLTLRVSPNQSLCRERPACVSFYDELLRRVTNLSGVYDAAAANTLPLASEIPALPLQIEGQPYVPSERAAPMFWAGAVTPGYFRLMRIGIVQGRAFTAADSEKSAPVAIVNASMARHYWPGENPVGKSIRVVFEDRWRTVVGVAADVRQYDLSGRSPDYIHGALYMPYPQAMDKDHQLPAAMSLIVETGADGGDVAPRIRSLIRDLNPNAPLSDIRSMESLVDDSTQQSRSMTWLFACFAAAALTLAAIGTYGVVSYSTTQRTFEIGVRVALGASKREILRSVLAQSLRLVLTGLAVGLAASLALTRMLSAFLYDTAPADLETFLVVSALLIAVALLAGYIPARRAATLDPLTALRVEPL